MMMNRVTKPWLGIGLFLVIILQVQAQECVGNGETAVLSCGLTLTGGVTITIATWRKLGPPDVTVAQYLAGTSTAGPAYTGRVSINDTGFLSLEQVTQADKGAYSCDATLSNSISPPIVEVKVGLKLTEVPDLDGVAVTAVEEASTSATVEWKEIPVNETCDEVLTYHIEYMLGSSNWESAGSVVGSAYGNTTMNFTVTGLNTAGTYTFGVKAENSLGMSSRVESNTVAISGTSSGGLSTGAIIGIAVGSIGGVALIAVIIWLIIHFNGKKQSSKGSKETNKARSQNQVDPEQQPPEEKITKSADLPTNEKERN